MNQPTTPFKLHASVLSPDAPVKPAGDLPAEVAGQPATYFWKDMIHTGTYVHPTRKFSLAVDRDRLGRWAEAGQQMLAAGLPSRSTAITPMRPAMWLDTSRNSSWKMIGCWACASSSEMKRP